MTMTNFGAQYDIHGGAYDLIYPHHEAEIAQAESLTKVKPSVKYWVHTGLVNTKGDKMSKSAGNVLDHQGRPEGVRLGHPEAVPAVAPLPGGHGLRREGPEADARRPISAMREKAKSMEERRATKARRRDSGKVLGPFYAASERRHRHAEGHSVHQEADRRRGFREGPEPGRALLRGAPDNLEHPRREHLWQIPMKGTLRTQRSLMVVELDRGGMARQGRLPAVLARISSEYFFNRGGFLRVTGPRSRRSSIRWRMSSRSAGLSRTSSSRATRSPPGFCRTLPRGGTG